MIQDHDGYWKVSTTTTPRARKAHRCGECRRVIDAGETYERFRALSDESYWFEAITCEHCVAARRWLSVVCHGWLYEAVLEDLEEHWQEHSWPVKTASLGKLIVGIRARWFIKGWRPSPGRIATWAEAGARLASTADVA
jgi:hypothetical protein